MPTERPFADLGLDGTEASGGADALRAPEPDAADAQRAPDVGGGDATADPGLGTDLPAPRSGWDNGSTSEARRSGSTDALASSSPLPPLPPLVAGGTPASGDAVERWMDDDRVAHADEPPLRPYRLLPPATDRPPATAHPPARQEPDDGPDDDRREPADDYEDPQVRAWRQEREFEAQFGPWRAGAGAGPRAPMRRSTLVSPPVLFLVFVVIVILFYAFTT